MITQEQQDILKERLTRTEGRRNRPYVDMVGKITIGIGHNLTDLGLKDETIDEIFVEDLQRAVEQAMTLPFYSNLNPIRQTVIIDMVFNMGIEKLLEFKKTLGYLSRGDYLGAADEMLLSTWARQVGNRAVELANILRSGRLN